MHGIVKALDSQGRLLVPREILNKLGIEPGQALEILVGADADGDPVIFLRRYNRLCVFCDRDVYPEEVVTFKERQLCIGCLKEIQKQGV